MYKCKLLKNNSWGVSVRYAFTNEYNNVNIIVVKTNFLYNKTSCSFGGLEYPNVNIAVIFK